MIWYTELELEEATRLMWAAEQMAGNRHGISEGDCRMLARMALEAAARVRAGAPPASVS